MIFDYRSTESFTNTRRSEKLDEAIMSLSEEEHIELCAAFQCVTEAITRIHTILDKFDSEGFDKEYNLFDEINKILKKSKLNTHF